MNKELTDLQQLDLIALGKLRTASMELLDKMQPSFQQQMALARLVEFDFWARSCIASYENSGKSEDKNDD